MRLFVFFFSHSHRFRRTFIAFRTVPMAHTRKSHSQKKKERKKRVKKKKKKKERSSDRGYSSLDICGAAWPFLGSTPQPQTVDLHPSVYVLKARSRNPKNSYVVESKTYATCTRQPVLAISVRSSARALPVSQFSLWCACIRRYCRAATAAPQILQ